MLDIIGKSEEGSWVHSLPSLEAPYHCACCSSPPPGAVLEFLILFFNKLSITLTWPLAPRVLPSMLNKNDPANQFLTKRKAGAWNWGKQFSLPPSTFLFFFSRLYATWEPGPCLCSSSLYSQHCVWDIVLGILYWTSTWINAKEHHQPMEVTGDFGLATFLSNKLMGWSALLGNHSR